MMQMLHHSVVLKRELTRNIKLLVFKLIFVAIFTHDYENWVMTERMRSQLLKSEIKLLQTSKEL